MNCRGFLSIIKNNFTRSSLLLHKYSFWINGILFSILTIQRIFKGLLIRQVTRRTDTCMLKYGSVEMLCPLCIPSQNRKTVHAAVGI
ncbi:MAG: hypothetical protein K0R51_1047 [Cytophagaceae bacterium]|jgi:hypothetical protein|nr:hypothetical protein [Cytophagaceae bacterium]